MRSRKELHEMTLDELRKKLRSQVMTGLREGVVASRIAEFYNKKNNVSGSTGAVSIIDTGKQTTVCGTGELFNNFLQTGRIENFSGFGSQPVKYYDVNFQDAAFRCVTFDQTFAGMPYDVRKAIVYDPHKDFFLQRSHPTKGRRNKAKFPSALQESSPVENIMSDGCMPNQEDIGHDSHKQSICVQRKSITFAPSSTSAEGNPTSEAPDLKALTQESSSSNRKDKTRKVKRLALKNVIVKDLTNVKHDNQKHGKYQDTGKIVHEVRPKNSSTVEEKSSRLNKSRASARDIQHNPLVLIGHADQHEDQCDTNDVDNILDALTCDTPPNSQENNTLQEEDNFPMQLDISFDFSCSIPEGINVNTSFDHSVPLSEDDLFLQSVLGEHVQ